jgi:hypothetical protein
MVRVAKQISTGQYLAGWQSGGEQYEEDGITPTGLMNYRLEVTKQDAIINLMERDGLTEVQAEADLVVEWVEESTVENKFAIDNAPSPLELWKIDMAASDAEIPRWAEDIYAALPLEARDAVNAVTKNKIVQKQAKRNSKPV